MTSFGYKRFDDPESYFDKNKKLNFFGSSHNIDLSKGEITPVEDCCTKEGFRGNQKEVVKMIQDLFIKQNYKFVGLRAPTGSGKSLIATTMAKAMGSAYILTPYKLLQDQYTNEFPAYVTTLKGRASYPCIKVNGLDCKNGPCKDNKEPDIPWACEIASSCKYHVQKNMAALSRMTVFNFYAGLIFINYQTKFFKERTIMILDECHALADNLSSYLELSFSNYAMEYEYMVGSIPNIKNPTVESYIPWLEKVANFLEQKSHFESMGIEGEDPKTTKDRKMAGKIRSFLEVLSAGSSNWAVIVSLGKYKNKIIVKDLTFKPIDVSEAAEEMLFSKVDHVLLLSATIPSHPILMNELGIKENNYKAIGMRSVFPFKNSPIIPLNLIGMNYRNREKSNKIGFRDGILPILKCYHDCRGIIHVNSFDIGDHIMTLLQEAMDQGELESRPIIYTGEKNPLIDRRNKLDFDKLMEIHMAQPNTVIISPGNMKEGVDLYGERARFGIIFKAPFLNYTEEYNKRKNEHSSKVTDQYQWTDVKCAETLVQMVGRTMRNIQDFSDTYLIDSNISSFYYKNKVLFPQEFQDSWDRDERIYKRYMLR